MSTLGTGAIVVLTRSWTLSGTPARGTLVIALARLRVFVDTVSDHVPSRKSEVG